MNFANICSDLITGLIPIEGASGEITRQAYYDKYLEWINTGQFVPIVYVNTVTSQLAMGNTPEINFTVSDITTATDWICINAAI